MFQGIQGPPAEGMVLDKGVGRDPLAPHGRPQRVIYDQKNHLARGLHCNLQDRRPDDLKCERRKAYEKTGMVSFDGLMSGAGIAAGDGVGG